MELKKKLSFGNCSTPALDWQFIKVFTIFALAQAVDFFCRLIDFFPHRIGYQHLRPVA
jgi:hypothetical protein